MEQGPSNVPQNAEAIILNIREQMMSMGRNDSEWSAIDAILQKLRNGECSPAEAIAAAQHILDTKQDYN